MGATQSIECVSVLQDVTVIVPLAPGESHYVPLLDDLRCAEFAELLLVCVDGERERHQKVLAEKRLPFPARVLISERGRAVQQNTGACEAKSSFIWFVHADSRVTPRSLKNLHDSLEGRADALYYFDLGFDAGGVSPLRINEIGVWLRSHLLGMPFGDQGFCLKRETFERLGAFDTGAPYGEDHLLVWIARRRKLPLRSVGAVLLTSARKYQTGGWSRVTSKHLKLTYAQAWPQFLLWMRGQ